MTESVEDFRLRDFRGKKQATVDKPVKSPSVHIARGYERNIPILACGRPIICLSDWQCEVPTQRYFWSQAWTILQNKIGSKLLERALVLVAGDMASKDNSLRGPKSDAVPDFSWLRESFPRADILVVYGNHDNISPEHMQMMNDVSGLPCLLPHGSWVGVPAEGKRYNLVSVDETTAILNQSPSKNGQRRRPKEPRAAHIPDFLQHMTKQERKAYYAKQSFTKKAKGSQKDSASKARQWDRDNPEQAHLTACFRQVQSLVQERAAADPLAPPPLIRIGAVHGIPASHNQGMKKVEREEYFGAIGRVCDPKSPIDILVTHQPPCIPGQEAFVKGDDPIQTYEAFLQSQAYLHVCGHVHVDTPVSVVSEGKVVVNVDCRVVAFLPPSAGMEA